MSPLGTEEEVKVLTHRLLRFFLSKRTSSLDDAQDLVQETLLRVLQAASGEKLESPEGYAIGVAKKITFEYYRKRGKAQKHESIEYDSESEAYSPKYNGIKHFDTPEKLAIHKDLWCKLHSGMEDLPTNMKDLLVERFIKEVPSKVIASRFGVTPETVDMRVYRAKHELRRHMS